MSANQPPNWSGDDPDWNEDKTVVIPTPGGGRRRPDLSGGAPAPTQAPVGQIAQPRPALQAPEPPRYATSPQYPREYPQEDEARSGPVAARSHGTGINPLVAAATPLLGLLTAVRQAPSLSDPMALRARIEQQLRAFARDSAQTGASPTTLDNASYCLATALDEAVLRTPWGTQSEWRTLSLLQQLHGDAWGGEKFFKILKAAMDNPAPNIDLLELLYICLALGFEGQYAIFDDGPRNLERKVEELYTLIRRQRGPVEHELSPHWRNEEAARVALEHPLPVWVLGVVAGALLIAAYLAFSFFLADASKPVMDRFASLGEVELTVIDPTPLPTPAADAMPVLQLPPPPPPPPVAAAEPLRGFLKEEVARGLVEIAESATQVGVTLVGSAIFASGSDQLSPDYVTIIERIAAGIVAHRDQLGGDIIVVGHTDNIPLRRSLRFQDNYDLSLARANTVAELIQAQPGINRPVERDGKGDREPVGGGDPASGNRTPEQRAANRRVEILIEK